MGFFRKRFHVLRNGVTQCLHRIFKFFKGFAKGSHFHFRLRYIIPGELLHGGPGLQIGVDQWAAFAQLCLHLVRHRHRSDLGDVGLEFLCVFLKAFFRLSHSGVRTFLGMQDAQKHIATNRVVHHVCGLAFAQDQIGRV